MSLEGGGFVQKIIGAILIILASGGIGGLYQHSTHFPHLTGDALEVAKKHHLRLEPLE